MSVACVGAFLPLLMCGRCVAQPAARGNAAGPAVELRGIWFVGQDLLKPRDEIVRMLDALASARFNTLFVDVWWRGYTLYPGSAIVPQMRALEGRDTVRFVLDEARHRGMQVHFWIGYGFY